MDSTPIVGGTGKGASGAASIFGDNSRNAANPLTTIAGALAVLAVVGLIVWFITKGK